MIKEAINKLIDKINLSCQEVEGVFEEIMTGKATPAQTASFLTALRMKGETVDEITGAASIMRKFVVKIKTKGDIILDTCGTGADSSSTFNISTISAFVISGCGIKVAKHGNRSITSRCGSADLLEALGININLAPENIEACIEKVGIGFLFAPNLHPAMKYALPIRKELGIRTIFNILGPLTNPAFATHQLLGVYEMRLVKPLAYVLKNLGLRHVLVVHGLDGLDEITTTTKTKVAELKGGKVRLFKIEPLKYGIKRTKLEDLKGGDTLLNIQIAKHVLEGKPGPKRNIVILNAGCAIYTADKVGDIKEGIAMAEDSIDSGKALEKLKQLAEFCSKVS